MGQDGTRWDKMGQDGISLDEVEQDGTRCLSLASFKEYQRPDRSDNGSHLGAAVLAHMARSAAVDRTLLLDEKSL